MDRRTLRGILIGLGIAALAVPALGLPLLLTHRQELPLERAVGTAVVGIVARFGGGSAVNPRANDARALERGRDAWVGSCGMCHGAKGDGRGLLGPSSYPPASDLTSASIRGWTDAQLYWVIKNGLAFTAMPSFGAQFPDDDLWSLVAYVRALQARNAPTVSVAEASAAERARADPYGTPAERGAAVYFAQGCDRCHGPTGDAPDELSIRGRAAPETVRTGNDGMPRYGLDRISNEELGDLLAYMATFPIR